MSKAIKLTFTAIEPLVITDGTTEGMKHQCLDYIPGNMILGALAARWVKTNVGSIPDEDAEFQMLFFSPTTRYLNAYPLLNGNRTWPTPHTLKHIKNQLALPEPKSSLDPQPVVINSLAFADVSPEEERSYVNELRKLPPETAMQFKKVKPAFICPKTKIRADIKKGWGMHVAMDHTLRRHADKQLFGYQSICPGAEFESAIIFDNDAMYDAIDRMLVGNSEIHVGHARSAGYGRVRIEKSNLNDGYPETAAQSITGKLRVMLMSDYIPKCSWEEPLKGLEADLATELGAKVKIDDGKNFCAYRKVQGFNAHWRLPRTTRISLQKGSVITFSLNGASVEETKVKAVLNSGIGGFRNEGFGRITFNPPMLEEKNLSFSKLKTAWDTASAAAATTPATTLPLLRKRALRRIADQAARDFLASSKVQEFLKGACPGSGDLHWKPANSQLSNIRSMAYNKDRSMWVTTFEELLQKTAAPQWKNCKVHNFMPVPAMEHLDAVIHDFLDTDKFTQMITSFDTQTDKIPGGAPNDLERNTALDRIHRLSVAGLMEAIVTIRYRGKVKSTGKEARA